MNYANEVHRFGRAGELYAQADPEKLHKVIDAMVAKHVAWDPTFSIYEASRDLVRAQNQPWFKDYLHPSMEEYFRGSTENHGSYFFGWTSTQESNWRRQYRIWMDAVREFAHKGGRVTTGDDAGYIYSMYGFGIARELELHQEAGFHPLEVMEHARWNGAKLIGMEDRLGKVREGFIADLLVVNGNPLENLKLLNPYGADVMMVNGKPMPNYTPIGSGDRVQNARGGGIEWTIKDGIPYHVPTLMREVKEMVTKVRERRGVLAPARWRADRADGARSLCEAGRDRCDARTRHTKRFRRERSLAPLLRSDWLRLGARARVAQEPFGEVGFLARNHENTKTRNTNTSFRFRVFVISCFRG